MAKYIELGKNNILKIDRKAEHGLYLIAEDGESVLLPNAYVENSMKIGDEIEVFIYTDSEDRLVATTLTPFGKVGDFVALRVVDNMKYGAFMDWGLPKDLFIPKEYQRSRFNIGEIKVVRIMEDRSTDRIYGTEKIEQFYSRDFRPLKRNLEVDLIILKKTPLGYKVLINESYEGLLFDNEIFQTLEIGQKVKGYIKFIRPDRKVDVSLQPLGDGASKVGAEKVFQILEESGGKLNFNYKSDAEEINEKFGMSRKTFKKSLTELLEAKKIKLDENGISI